MRPNRRSAMRVKDGRVQKKNNWTIDAGDYMVRRQAEIRIERKDPGYASRHLITVAQLRAFIELLPDWDEVAVGLDAIALDTWDDCMGWRVPGVVAVASWDAEVWWDDAIPAFIAEHRHIIELLDVDIHEPDGGPIQVQWTEEKARAFQCLHILRTSSATTTTA